MELQYIKALEGQVGGFNYDNCLRNRALIESKTENKTSLQYTKTGTTICGVVFKVSTTLFKINLVIGWSMHCCRYQINRWCHCRRQKLLQNPLPCSKYLHLRSWYCC